MAYWIFTAVCIAFSKKIVGQIIDRGVYLTWEFLT